VSLSRGAGGVAADVRRGHRLVRLGSEPGQGRGQRIERPALDNSLDFGGEPASSRRPSRMSAGGVATACQSLSAAVMRSLGPGFSATFQAGQL
jgi:hypothetical protein